MAVITLGFAASAFFAPPFLKQMEFFFYDQFMAIKATPGEVKGGAKEEMTIVDIDETSQSAVGQWPWPRYRVARLLAALSGD